MNDTQLSLVVEGSQCCSRVEAKMVVILIEGECARTQMKQVLQEPTSKNQNSTSLGIMISQRGGKEMRQMA